VKDSQQIWLESLPPEVRKDAEADIALYDSPEAESTIDIDEDWRPPAKSGMGLTVEFSREEINTLTKAFGASVEMFDIMHDALMEQAKVVLAERGASDSDSVAAVD
jgi:hypothetical protein